MEDEQAQFVDAQGNPVARASRHTATELYKGGAYSAIAPVHVADPSGAVRLVSPEELPDAVRSGARILPGAEGAEAMRRAQGEERFGGIGGAVQAFGQGAASVASLGTSPLVFEEMGVPLEDQRSIRETQGAAYEAGRLFGVAPAIAVTMATGGGAAGAGAAATGATAAGAAVGGAVAQAAGRTVLQTIGRAAMQEAVVGAVFGAGDAINEDLINNRPLTAESVLGGAAVGGTVGAAFGSLFGAVAARGAARAARSEAAAAFESDAASVASAAEAEAIAAGATRTEAEAAGRQAVSQMEDAGRTIANAAEADVEAAVASMPWHERFTRWVNRAAARGLGPPTADVRQAAAREVGQEMADRLGVSGDLMNDLGNFAISRGVLSRGLRSNSPEQVLVRARDVKLAAGNEVEAAVREVIENSQELRADLNPVRETYDEILGQMRADRSASGASDANAFKREMDDILFGNAEVPAAPTGNTRAAMVVRDGERVLEDVPEWTEASVRRELRPMDFQQVREARQMVSGVVERYKSQSAVADDTPLVRNLKRMWSQLKAAEEELAGRVPDEIVRARYEMANRNYQLAALAEQLAKSGYDRLVMQGVGDAGATGEAVRWAARFSPQNAIAAILSGAARGFIRNNAGKGVGAILGSAGKEAVINNANAQAERQVARAVSSMFSNKNTARAIATGSGLVAATRMSRKTAEEAAMAILVSQESGSLPTLPEDVSGVAESAPGIAQDIRDRQVARIRFLHSKLPNRASQAADRNEAAERIRNASKADMDRFALRTEAALDPTVLLKGLATNTLTPEIVEASSVVFPAYVAAARDAVYNELISKTGPVPARVSRTIRILGGNISTSASPQMVVTLQQSYSSNFQTMPQGPGRPRKPNITASDYVASQADATSARLSTGR